MIANPGGPPASASPSHAGRRGRRALCRGRGRFSRTSGYRIAAAICATLFLLLSPGAGRGAAASSPRVAIQAAGDDRGVWLIRSSSHDSLAEARGFGVESRLNVMAWQAVGGARLEPATIAPEVGRIARWAASGSYLFVFFEDGTHRSYSLSARQIEIDLPERAVPLAIGGMVGERTRPRVGLYAVVHHRIGSQISRREREAAATTRPAGASSRPWPPGDSETTPSMQISPGDADAPTGAGSAPSGQMTIEALPTAALDLVAYEGGRWQYVAPIEGWADEPDAGRFWLCASPQAVYVFHARAGADAIDTVDCLCRQEGRWSRLPSIDLSGPLGEGAALYIEPRAAFAAGVRRAVRESASPDGAAASDDRATASQAAGNASSPAVWRVWSLVENQWLGGEPLVFDSDEAACPEPVPGRSAVASLGQNVFLASLDRTDEIQVGIWPPEGGPAKRRPAASRVFELPRKPLVDPRTRDWLGLFVVLVIIAGVFWGRQDSLTTAARVPTNYMLAAYWKRLVGAILDGLPAAVLTASIWYGPLRGYYDNLIAAGASWSDTVPPVPDAVLLGWLSLRVVYAAYCALFERQWGTTPGKWLLGCRVMRETGDAPSTRDVVIRNAARILELEMYLPIWPLAMIVFFTRNRQRLGDLFARTVVVERARPVSNAPPEDGSSWGE